MEWTEKQILEMLKFIEASDYDEVKLEAHNFRLHVRKSGAPASGVHAEVAAALAATPPAQLRREDEGIASAGAPDRSDSGGVPTGMIAIRAPIMGTFYRAPAPHLPPFVEVGTRVKPDDTVCLIEVMKLFNTIKAGITGTVVKIVAGNGATVKKDELLIVIEP